MRGERTIRAIVIGTLLGTAVCAASPSLGAEEVDRGVIRLASPSATANAETNADPLDPKETLGNGERRGFDYVAFGARFESLWFHRKAYLTEGRPDEALRQSELIRSFVIEEGVRRLDTPAAALVWEAERYLLEGNTNRALAALHLAQSLDPERSQIHLLRARVLWASGAGPVAAGAEALRGVRGAVRSFVANPDRLQPVAIVAFFAFLCTCGAFACLMAARYQAPLRHEVEEWMRGSGHDTLANPAGWAVFFLPLLTWIAAGWIFFYWIVATFRFMRRTERTVALVLLLGVGLSLPLYRGSVGLYGRTADPRIRTTFAAASGEYDPELIVRLRELVDADPEDMTYRFLLAGLYKDGRFFEEAFDEYRRVLALNPSAWQAYVNIGNLYLQMGQYGEAIAQYRRALDIRPDAVIALMNTYYAQTESFRLNEAGATLELARRLDGALVAEMLSVGRAGAGQAVRDATLDLRAVWGKVIDGERSLDAVGPSSVSQRLRGFAHGALSPTALFAFLTAGAALVSVWAGGKPARRCQPCGRPYCGRCKSSKDAPEYCSHCVHLFVFGDGLSPETRSRKLYEIERFDRRTRAISRLASAAIPGCGEIWSGKTTRGVVLCGLWTSALLATIPAVAGPLESLLGLDLHLDVLRIGTVPPIAHLEPVTLLSVPLLLVAWALSNLPTWIRRREA